MNLRDELKAHDLWARKSLGQHFLLDPSITRRIAALAGPLDGHAVLEIGPGPGGLTRALLETPLKRLIAVEKDARFLPLLQGLNDPRLEIVQADALTIDEPTLLQGERACIVANLPYNVGTPLLVKWLKAGWPSAMILMFQKEVAQRIVAAPGDDAYGRLAVLAQAVCAGEIVLHLPPGAFTPPPKVASAVVRLDPLPAPYPHLDALERVTAAAFGQRRKMLRSSLASLGGEALLAAAHIPPTARAEEIAVADFLRLTEAWRAGAGVSFPGFATQKPGPTE